MKIKSLCFKNPFEGFQDIIEIRSLDDINIFIGKNNSGKTTILNTIYQILKRDFNSNKLLLKIQIELKLNEFTEFFNSFARSIDKPAEFFKKIRGELSVISTNNKHPEISIFIEFNLEPNNKLINIDVFLVNHNNYNNNAPKKEIISFQESLYELKEEFQDTKEAKIRIFNNLIQKIKIFFLPANRILEHGIKQHERKDLENCEETLRAILIDGFHTNVGKALGDPIKENLFKIPNFSLILNLIKNNELTNPAIKNTFTNEFFIKFQKSLKTIFPEIDLSMQFQLTILQSFGEFAEFNRKIGDWKSLGHGSQELISLLFLLIIPRNIIYLIDEPEIGLHPGLQHKLLQFIKKELITKKSHSKQFFFATHSTSFIDFRSNSSHYICSKDFNHFFVKPFEKRDIDLIKKELGLTPSDLLQANGLIWVEGISDKFYIEMLINCFDENLDDLGILVVPFHGGETIKKGQYSLEFLEKINNNFSIIIDSEKNSEEDPLDLELFSKKSEFEGKGHIFWILEDFCNIEGLFPQEIINEFLELESDLPSEYLKRHYEKLEDYIKRLKQQNIIDKDRKTYNKVRDAPKICQIVLNNPEYINIIKKNSYIKKNVGILIKEIYKWISGSLEQEFKEDSNVYKESKYPTEEIMQSLIAKFQHSDSDDKKNKIVGEFQDFGIIGTQFLLEESMSNKYGLAEPSGFILNEFQPNWRKEFNLPTSKFYVSSADSIKKNSIEIESIYKNIELLKNERISIESIKQILKSCKTQFQKLADIHKVDRDTFQTLKMFIEFTSQFIIDKDEKVIRIVLSIYQEILHIEGTLNIIKNNTYEFLKTLFEKNLRFNILTYFLHQFGFFENPIDEIFEAINNKDYLLFRFFRNNIRNYPIIKKNKFDIKRKLFTKIEALDPKEDKSLIKDIREFIDMIDQL